MDEQSRRKFLKQFAVLSAGVYTAILTGCEMTPVYGPVVNPVYGTPPIDSDPEDETGNLFIRSVQGFELVLYGRYNRLKIIGQTTSLFRVNVVRNSQVENELEMFRYVDAIGDLDNPPKSDILKRWLVNLPSEINNNPNYIWIIDDNPPADCGELILNYNPVSDVKVAVNMIIPERRTYTEQIMPEKPVHLGLAYGDYTIEYTYWRGNTPKAGERVELGKITTEIVDGEEVPIRLSLNVENRKVERTIPNWEG